jgi:hypothetical protein
MRVSGTVDNTVRRRARWVQRVRAQFLADLAPQFLQAGELTPEL